MPSELDDLRLIQEWKQGDEKAFETIYRKYLFFLVEIAAKKLENKNQALDLVQDIMLEVYRSKEILTIHTTLQGYLLTALRYKVFKYKKDYLVKIQEVDNENVATLNSGNNVFEYINRKELERKLRSIVTNLPEQCRKVFVLSREHHLSNKEIAGEMGISVNTVEQHMRKALRVLRQIIKYK